MKQVLLCLVLAACAPEPTPVARTPVTIPPVATTTTPEPAPSAATASSPLSCARTLPSFAFVAPADGDRTPSAGQMTEEAAQAKRLFDRERWDDAVLQLGRVANGDTGDDEGNKQLAAYQRAVALFHGGRMDDALAAFLAIAGLPAHIKHAETVLWLTKLSDTAPVAVRGLAYYDATIAQRFDNAPQHELYQAVLFLVGRERFERGAKPEARDLFARVEPASRWYTLARECLDRLGAR
jgi:hypothetical protein